MIRKKLEAPHPPSKEIQVERPTGTLLNHRSGNFSVDVAFGEFLRVIQ